MLLITASRIPQRDCARWAALLFLLTAMSAGHSQPARGPADIDSFFYPDNAAAQAAWKPMGESATVAVSVMDGRKVLRFPCNFEGTKIERASWDRPVELDLTSSRGIEFQILCRDATPVSYFSIYFQSGSGWYHASFFPESNTDWSTITVRKSDITMEGQPAGWGQISTIRISAWRSRDVNTEFCLRDLRQTGLLGADAFVAVVRADSVARSRSEEKRSVEQFTDAMVANFAASDINCSVISDLDLAAVGLKGARLVVLPHNPDMPERGLDEVLRYLGTGGKLLAFYNFPDRLRSAVHMEPSRYMAAPSSGYFSAIRVKAGTLPGAPTLINQRSWNISAIQPVPGQSQAIGEWLDDKGKPVGQTAIVASTNCILMTHVLLPDDAGNKRRLLLAMAGALAPDLWRQTAQAGIDRITEFGGFKNFEEAVEQLTTGKGVVSSKPQPLDAPKVAQAIEAATQARKAALRLFGEQKFAESLEQSAAARQDVQRAFCLAQEPLPGEFRAFWCHSAFGVEGHSWEDAIRQLADNGFTAILPNMLWGGTAYYPSKVLPIAPEVGQRGDQVAECLAACRKHGLQVHVWKVNWNLSSRAPREFVERMRREGRLQANAQGREEPWLCPSAPENQKLEVESLLELVRNYDIDGVHLDYIRYPDGDHCFCAGCRQHFEAVVGKVKTWPADVLGSGPLRRPWLDWRRGNITSVVKAVSEQARSIRPKIKISAAVFPNWATDRDGVGQDWKLWCDRGYLDFACPMDYTPSNRSFENLVSRQVQWTGRVPCYPGIGYSASSSHFGADRAIDQIKVTRRYHTGGFVIFNYAKAEYAELLPLLGMGITARR
jgi:uncharacterized lipoprotein YddW (UPF0748 family)